MFFTVLDIGVKITLGITAVFVVVFFYMCYLWSNMHPKAQRREIGLMVSIIYGFLVFISGTAVSIIVAFIWEMVPRIVEFLW